MKKKWIFALISLLALAGILVGYHIGGLLMSGAVSDRISANERVDYVVILGCRLDGEKPERILQSRIDAAVDFLKKYPDAVAICTGGQGEDESIPESSAIQKALRKAGISQKRLLTETASTNTYENLQNAKTLIEERENGDDVRIAIVTSEYHLYRARYLAKLLGFQDPIGVAAETPTVLFYPNFLREICAMAAAWMRY